MAIWRALYSGTPGLSDKIDIGENRVKYPNFKDLWYNYVARRVQPPFVYIN